MTTTSIIALLIGSWLFLKVSRLLALTFVAVAIGITITIMSL